MEYMGRWSEKYSEQFGEVVDILEHKSEYKIINQLFSIICIGEVRK